MGRWDSGEIRRRISIPRLIFFLLSMSFLVFTLVSSFMPDPATSAQPFSDIEIPGMKKPLEAIEIGH